MRKQLSELCSIKSDDEIIEDLIKEPVHLLLKKRATRIYYKNGEHKKRNKRTITRVDMLLDPHYYAGIEKIKSIEQQLHSNLTYEFCYDEKLSLMCVRHDSDDIIVNDKFYDIDSETGVEPIAHRFNYAFTRKTAKEFVGDPLQWCIDNHISTSINQINVFNFKNIDFRIPLKEEEENNEEFAELISAVINKIDEIKISDTSTADINFLISVIDTIEHNQLILPGNLVEMLSSRQYNKDVLNLMHSSLAERVEELGLDVIRVFIPIFLGMHKYNSHINKEAYADMYESFLLKTFYDI